MDRKSFYSQYRQARFLMTAQAKYSIEGDVKAPEGLMLFDGIKEVAHPSIYYAIMNSRKNITYPISSHRWAVKHNHLF